MGEDNQRPARWTIVGAYVVVCVIWGTTWFSMKVAVATIPPITAAGLRFTAAFPFLAVLVWATPGVRFTIPGKNWLIGFLAVAYVGVPYALINYGEQSVSSGLASLLFASVTVFLLIFSRLISGTRITLLQGVGVMAGIVLLAGLLVVSGRGFGTDGWLPAIAVLVAACLHALCYAVLARYGADVPVLTTEALPVGLGGIALLLLGLTTEHPHFSSFSTASWLGVAYLAVVASVAGFAAYFYLLKHLPPLTVSYVFVLFPVIAVFVSSVAESTPLDPVAYALAAAMLGAFALTGLEQALRRLNASLVYLTPTFHNPTGGTVPPERRAAIAALTAKHHVPLVEDLALGDLGLDHEPPPPLYTHTPAGHIFSIGSLSKLYWPGLRVGWVRRPAQHPADIAGLKAVDDFGTPLAAQTLALALLDRHDDIKQERRRELIDKRDLLRNILTQRLPGWTIPSPAGGLSLWAEAPSDIETLRQHAMRHGINPLVDQHFWVGTDLVPTRHFRLPYTMDHPHLTDLANRLGDLWDAK